MPNSVTTESGEPIDPDVDLRQPGQQRELLRSQGAILAATSCGGAIGALARYGLITAWPTPAGHFPWAVFTINVLGCFLIGVLMVSITEIRPAHPVVRPFLGVGILGGFTTFSTYTNDIRALLHPGAAVTAFGYLAGTLVCALLATLTAIRLTRWAYRATTLRKAVA